MNRLTEPILHLPESVVQDVGGYRANVKKFVDGGTSPVAFRAYRVPMGIYEQRITGKYMVRIRIGAGLVRPYQLEKIAQLSKTYGSGIVHITTRQDIQIHEVDIENTPDVLEGLLEVGLSARGGGGNTVRNVTACPRAGVCPKEEFDVAPYAVATAEYLLQFKSSYNLPRKYKIVFSGCSDDCAFASVADLAFFAHVQNGQKGFAVYAGGGLGPNPRIGVKVEDFVDGGEIFEVAEAVKRFFDEYGDRTNKHKARLRYVLARLGEEEFVKLYKEHRSRLKSEGLSGDIPQIKSQNTEYRIQNTEVRGDVLAEKEQGLFTVCLRIDRGEISAENLVKVGQIAEKFGSGIVRTTQLQDILISGVSEENIEAVKTAAKEAGIDASGDGCPKIVVCAGAATCKLGLCLSRGLADAIVEELSKVKISAKHRDIVIRISGCPNSCANHYIADIGFEGKAKRINEKLMPFYDVLVGAKIAEGASRLAEGVGTVPAKRIPQLVAEALSNGSIEKERIKNIVDQYSDIDLSQLPDEYYYDFGSDEPFSLAGRGPGECGAGVLDVIKVDIDEAREAIEAAQAATDAKSKSESVYKAIVSACRALLVTFGLEPKRDREAFAAFSEHLIGPGWVEQQTQQLLDKAIGWRMGEVASIDDLTAQTEGLANRVEELFGSLDANLKFRVKPATEKVSLQKTDVQNSTVDLRGVECPLNFVKAKLALEKVAVGEIIEILLDDGEPVRNVPDSFTQQGQEVLEVKKIDDHFCVKVQRKK